MDRRQNETREYRCRLIFSSSLHALFRVWSVEVASIISRLVASLKPHNPTMDTLLAIIPEDRSVAALTIVGGLFVAKLALQVGSPLDPRPKVSFSLFLHPPDDWSHLQALPASW